MERVVYLVIESQWYLLDQEDGLERDVVKHYYLKKDTAIDAAKKLAEKKLLHLCRIANFRKYGYLRDPQSDDVEGGIYEKRVCRWPDDEVLYRYWVKKVNT